MKSFFSGLKLGAPSTAPVSSNAQASVLKRSPSQADQQMPEMLGKAEKLLNRLRSSTQHDFPLLNNATRLVQLLEGAVTKMPENDMKGVWREQVNELQRGLQSATEQMLAQDTTPADMAPAVRPVEGRKASSKLKPQEAASSGGYSAPAMPIESVDMFSGLDLSGSASHAIQPDAMPPAAEAMVDRNVSSGSLPLPADLFSGLEQLTVEPSIASHSVTFLTPVVPTQPLPSSTTPAAGGRPVLSGPSIVAKPQSQPSSATTPTTSAALQEGHSLPPGQVLAPAPLTAAAPEGRRKKKTTRRVGYARDQPGEASTGSAASDTASLPSVSASTPDNALKAADSRIAQTQPQPSVALAPTPLVAVAADTKPVASTTAAAVATKAPAKLDMGQAPVSQLQALPSQPAQPKSPVKATPHKEAPAAVSPKRHHHKAAASTAAAAAPAAVLQLTSLSLTDAVAAANSAAPLHTVKPAGLASLGIMPVALTSEALLQAAKGVSFEEGLQAVQTRAQQHIALLTEAINSAVLDEQAVRQKRHTFTLEAVADMSQVRQLEDAEQLAVEQEDFESAANLSSELDVLRAHIQALERSARAGEAECEAAVARRADKARQQATAWQAAAQATAHLQTAQQQKAAKAAKQAQKEGSKLADAIAASEEHVEELKARITARQDWITREQQSVDAKIEEATRPVTSQRTEAAEQHSSLQEEVEDLRRQLAEKEEALAAAADKLADIDQHMHSLAAKYDKTLARLAEDRRAVATEEAERDAEEIAVQSTREQAVATEAAAKQQQALLEEQVAAAAAAASEMLGRAAAISAALEAEEHLRQIQAGLRDQEEQANDAVKELERDLEASRVSLRALASQRAGLANEAAAAEAQAAVAQRRIPELENDKKAAAAARDFKGAAALSAEAKALAAQADVAMTKAKQLRQQVSEAEEQEQLQVDSIKEQEGFLTQAKRAAALARWRRLQSSMQGLAHQVEEAAASDKFEEANALQAELDSSTEEASALAAEYSFTSADMQDLAVTASLLTEQSLPQQSAPNTGSSAKEQIEEGSKQPQVAIAEDRSAGRKTQDSQDLSNALSREGMLDYEDGDSVDVDVGYSSSVVSASHAATDGSRSVQSARTVLDRMPEFNMDDAVSFRSVSSSRSQPVHADTRSIRTMSTILDDGNQPDEADDASSLRSMSSTTSTNYGAPRPRPTVKPLYPIPDEAAASEDGDEGDTSSQSETEAAQDLPASAAAQALHQEADELMVSSQHASSSADSLPDVSLDPETDPKSRGLGSNESSSGNSGLSPVSEGESSGQATNTRGYDEEGLPMGQLQTTITLNNHLPALLTHEILNDKDKEDMQPSVSHAAATQALQTASAQPGTLNSQAIIAEPESLHTPRAMSPPSTPGAPLVPKIDAGPAADPPAELAQLRQSTSDVEQPQADVADDTMFAGLDMM